MDESDIEQTTKNREIVAALRESFAPLTLRLVPDVEPATAYKPITAQREDEE